MPALLSRLVFWFPAIGFTLEFPRMAKVVNSGQVREFYFNKSTRQAGWRIKGLGWRMSQRLVLTNSVELNLEVVTQSSLCWDAYIMDGDMCRWSSPAPVAWFPFQPIFKTSCSLRESWLITRSALVTSHALGHMIGGRYWWYPPPQDVLIVEFLELEKLHSV